MFLRYGFLPPFIIDLDVCPCCLPPGSMSAIRILVVEDRRGIKCISPWLVLFIHLTVRVCGLRKGRTIDLLEVDPEAFWPMPTLKWDNWLHQRSVAHLELREHIISTQIRSDLNQRLK